MSSLSKRLAQMPPDQRRSTLQDLPTHLARALQAEKLHHLLTNFNFMEAKVSALGVQPLIEDYGLVLNPDSLTSKEGVKLNVDSLRLIQGALQLSAHILDQDKTQLAGQLLGRLLCDGPSRWIKVHDQSLGHSVSIRLATADMIEVVLSDSRKDSPNIVNVCIATIDVLFPCRKNELC